MKKVLIVVAILLLLAVGGGAAYVLYDTEGAMELIGLKGPEDLTVAPSPRETAAASASSATAGGEEFDRRGGNRPPARPPSREDAAPAPSLDEVVNIPVSRKGRHVGTTSLSRSVEPPRHELYPLNIRRRSFPDAANILVEFAIQNSSGIHWRTAYVTFSSERREEGQVFQIDDWQIDETVGLEYVFPRSELNTRLAGLRVVDVSGERRQSALAELLSQDRRRYLEYALVSARLPQDRRREGGRLSAPGLLSLIGQFHAPVTGIEVRTAALTQAQPRPLRITLPEDLLLAGELDVVLRETSEERREAAHALGEFHREGLRTQEAIATFARALEQTGAANLSDQAAGEPLQDLRRQLGAFNSSGERLARLVRLSRDAEVRKAEAVWLGHSRKILGQLDRVEAEVRRIEPNFQIQN